MIFVILILALAIRIVNLDQSFWLDEATSIIAARDYSVNEILTKFSPGDFHPPLYYLLLKMWMGFLGSSEIAARSLSVLFGLGTIPFIYTLGKKLFSHKVGIFTALLLATAPLHIYYSQEARMYVFETFLATVVAYFFLRRNFVWLTLSSAALLYTDYLPIFLLVSLFIYLLLYEKEYSASAIRWVGGTALLFFPWIPTLLAQFSIGTQVKQNAPLWFETLGRTNLKELALVPVKFIIGRISSYDKVFYGVTVAVAAIPFVISFLNSIVRFSKTKLLWFWFLGPLILSAIFGALFSGFSYFRLLFILPAFYLLIAHGAFQLKNARLKKVVMASLVLVNLVSAGIYLSNPRFHREDWRSAISFIENNSKSNSAVVFVSKNQRDPYHYYARKVPSFGPEGADLNFSEIWLMRYVQNIFDPNDKLRATIESRGYTKIDEKDFNGVVVWRYVK